VGIGTISPGALLDVNNGANYLGGTYGIRSSGDYANVQFYSTLTSSNTRNWALAANWDNYGFFEIMQSNAKGGDPLNAGTSRLTIDTSGNVGIGTISPAKQLHTTGTVRFAALTKGFLAADTNGDLTTGAQVYNVKLYGALGDGSRNDATEIQNAVNAAVSAGGGCIYFPAGRYRLDSQVIATDADISFIGDGMGVTQLLVNNNTGG
jgi:hypothetical protein